MSLFSLSSKFVSFFTSVSVLILFFGCATSKKEENYSAKQLLQLGKRLAKKEDLEKAKAKIQQLMEDYPDSKVRVAAIMLLADVNFKEEEYEEEEGEEEAADDAAAPPDGNAVRIAANQTLASLSEVRFAAGRLAGQIRKTHFAVDGIIQRTAAMPVSGEI